MTKRQRARVVELLRCAADVSSIVAAGYATNQCDGVNPCTKVFSYARDAYRAVPDVLHADGWHAYPEFCLEAAQRVEDGEWP